VAGDPGAQDAIHDASASAGVVNDGPVDPNAAPVSAGLGGGTWFGASIGFAMLCLLTAASLLFTALRRLRTRRRLAARIAGRLAMFDRPLQPDSGPRSAERESGPFHSA
jgi:hypothetical protein